MNLENRISALLNKFLCFLKGHKGSIVCLRCGKLIEENDGNLFKRIKFNIYAIWAEKYRYKGSIPVKSGCGKYELNLKTNELRLLEYETEFALDENGHKTKEVISRKAKHNPNCVYFDAINDKNAIRKANNYIYGIKKNVRITKISK